MDSNGFRNESFFAIISIEFSASGDNSVREFASSLAGLADEAFKDSTGLAEAAAGAAGGAGVANAGAFSCSTYFLISCKESA